MASKLNSYRLEDCVDAIIDYRGKTPKKTKFGIPLITAKIIKNGRIQEVNEFISEDDYDSWMRRGIPKAGDIVLTTEAPMGEVAQLDDRKIALAQRVITLRGKKGLLNNDYLKYLLQSSGIQHQLDGRGTGTTVKGIKQSELREVILNFPNIPEQESVALILKTLDDKIECNRKTNETLEQMAEALFKSWFVDFDPVIDNALAAGNLIPDELQHRVEVRQKAHAMRESNPNIKPLSEHAQRLFPNEFEHCGDDKMGIAGWRPVGWNNSSIHDLVDTISKTYNLKDSEEVVFLNTGDIENGKFLHRKLSKTIGLPGQAKKSIESGDILYSEIRPKNKRFALVNFDASKYVVSTKLMVLRAKVGINPLLPYFVLTQPKTIELLQHVAEHRSGTFPQITFTELSQIKLLLPNNNEIVQVFLGTYLKEYYEKQELNNRQTETLQAIRDTILPKLINGDIELS